MTDFRYLDTTNMETVIKTCKEMAEAMRDLQLELISAKDALVADWDGDASNTFRKKFPTVMRRCTDITEETWEVYQRLLDAEVAYLEADIDAAKAK